MGLDFDYSEGQTPLDEEEKEGLLIQTITTRGELDEFEQLGVETANEWLLARKLSIKRILTEDFVKDFYTNLMKEFASHLSSMEIRIVTDNAYKHYSDKHQENEWYYFEIRACKVESITGEKS